MFAANVCIQDQNFINLENDTMRLSVSEAKWTDLSADFKFFLRARKVTEGKQTRELRILVANVIIKCLNMEIPC